MLQSEAHQYYSSSGNIGGSLEGALSKSDFAEEAVNKSPQPLPVGGREITVAS